MTSTPPLTPEDVPKTGTIFRNLLSLDITVTKESLESETSLAFKVRASDPTIYRKFVESGMDDTSIRTAMLQIKGYCDDVLTEIDKVGSEV